MTESRMLRRCAIRAWRAAGSVVSLSPNRRSNTARGLFSIGSGVVAARQHSVLTYAQLYPTSHAPAMPAVSSPSSSEASCVC